MKRLYAALAAACTFAGIMVAAAAPASAAPAHPAAAAAPVLMAHPGQPAAFGRWHDRCLRPPRDRPLYCKRRAALAWELTQRGCPYVYGGTGPCANGYDCSGLTMMAYAHVGYWLPRTTSEMQVSSRLRRVWHPRPGEVILYGWPAYHAAMVVSSGEEVEAPHTGTVVQEEAINWAAGPQFYTIR